jgi:hypothetical protein
MHADEWRDLREQIPQRASLDEIDQALAQNPSLSEDDRAALWLYAWSRSQRDRHGDEFPINERTLGESIRAPLGRLFGLLRPYQADSPS